ncbi:hypothetical protein CsSME_00013300 [Camellia sinensis var. sinensis]
MDGWMDDAGCARVEGDEEEDDIDDVENEFNFEGRVRDSAKLLDSQQHSLARSEAMLHGHSGGSHMSYGHIFDSSELHPHVFHNTNNSNTLPQLPLLTNGHMVRLPLLLLLLWNSKNHCMQISDSRSLRPAAFVFAGG